MLLTVLKTRHAGASLVSAMILSSVIMILAGAACKKIAAGALLNGYEQTNLVSDVSGFGAARTDSNLVNAWGIAVAPSGPLWISANGTGLSTIYDKNGTTLRPPVAIPSPTSWNGGTPSGVVFNNTSDFMILNTKPSQPSKFIFATEDGIIAAWGSGNAAVVAADRSVFNAVYKGIALANDGGANFLYATNFHEGKIDVFDASFNYTTGRPFHDPAIPRGFAPFNIRNFGGWLYVTYAKQKAPDNHDDQAGPGNGIIDIFTPDGKLVKRFASFGALNSPWGIAQIKAGFCKEIEHGFLIGNFGDGRINLFDNDGLFIGPLEDDGRPIKIDGLWALENNVPQTDSTELYFTAGPDSESHGLFGYLKRR